MNGRRYRRAVSSLALWLSFGAAVISLGIVLYIAGAFLVEWMATAAGWYTPPPAGWLDEAIGEALRKAVIFMAVFAYAAIYVVPVFVLLPLLAPAIALWREPRRILMLRAFNRGNPNRALKRIARRALSPLGHVYTLADADIRVPWAARAAILFGQASLFSFRAKRLTTAAQVAKLPRLLGRTWLRNLNWCLSFSKVFPLRTSDAVWRLTVETLLPRTDAIVVDVSDTSASIAWEMQRCHALGLEHRMVYLVNDRLDRDLAIARCSQAFGFPLPEERLFVCGKQGLPLESELQRQVARISVPKADPGQRDGWLSKAALLAFGIGFFPELILAFYPETHEDAWTFHLIQWNAWQGSWPGITEVINGPALAVFGLGLLTFGLLILAARRNRSMSVLAGVQASIVALSAFGYFPSTFLLLTDLLERWL